jgi:hypothetical protein
VPSVEVVFDRGDPASAGGTLTILHVAAALAFVARS